MTMLWGFFIFIFYFFLGGVPASQHVNTESFDEQCHWIPNKTKPHILLLSIKP